MRFMLFIHPRLPPSTEENLIPSREAIGTMSRYNRQLHARTTTIKLVPRSTRS
jgi:hypothetical protein